nr:MAG TPA: hypothetical protein [Caudoviricetes sp.]
MPKMQIYCTIVAQITKEIRLCALMRSDLTLE